MDTGNPREVALTAISLLDLTNLNDDCTPADIEALCARAQTPHGNAAAICIWPRFVSQAAKLLAGTGIRIATVVNFPCGDLETDEVVAETRQAIEDGADEIDMVLDYRAFMAGERVKVADQMAAVRAACADPVLLKVILETGVLEDEDVIRAACGLAISAGADFLKTSTGKVEVNATPEAARILLGAIRQSGRPIGFKAAGGIRTTQDAALYLRLADEIMGEGWLGPRTFRFGASGVLTNLLATLDGDAETGGSGY